VLVAALLHGEAAFAQMPSGSGMPMGRPAIARLNPPPGDDHPRTVAAREALRRAQWAEARQRQSQRQAAARSTLDHLTLMSIASPPEGDQEELPPTSSSPQGGASVPALSAAATPGRPAPRWPTHAQVLEALLNAGRPPASEPDLEVMEDPAPVAAAAVPPSAQVDPRAAELLHQRGLSPDTVVTGIPEGGDEQLLFLLEPEGPHVHEGRRGRYVVGRALNAALSPLDLLLNAGRALFNHRYFERTPDGRFLVPRRRPL
jgi:hypothetical protein